LSLNPALPGPHDPLRPILQLLKLHHVRHLFGVPGDAINPLVDAIRRDGDTRFIHVNHEEAGAFAASAAAKLTGKLNVCAGTVGPGAIHLLNGLYDAKKDHAPVLALLGQVPTDNIGSDYHQEVDLPALFGDVACFLAEVRTPEQMPQLAIEACRSVRRACKIPTMSPSPPRSADSGTASIRPIKSSRTSPEPWPPPVP
jgi:thiamine pyrophosphate-dependent acetolactate synthase large subunit-like protein